MSILIKGMEMPKSCWECEVGSASQLDNKTCPFYAMEGQEQENYQNKIAEGCPLIPVPQHGRLIDADAIERGGWIASRTYQTSPTESVYETKHMNAFPTIIEAEEGE